MQWLDSARLDIYVMPSLKNSPVFTTHRPVIEFAMVTQESKIIIVGGGVFGLSTALWLARDGYKDITIFDRCQFDKNFYNPSNGCDGASADLNKIFRMAYGEKLE